MQLIQLSAKWCSDDRLFLHYIASLYLFENILSQPDAIIKSLIIFWNNTNEQQPMIYERHCVLTNMFVSVYCFSLLRFRSGRLLFPITPICVLKSSTSIMQFIDSIFLSSALLPLRILITRFDPCVFIPITVFFSEI